MSIHISNWTRSRIDSRQVRQWLRSIQKALIRRKVLSSRDSFELEVAFIGKKKSQELNNRFRGKNSPTDVLSFAPTLTGQLGELALCWPIVREQAREHGLSIDQECGYLLLHGILHLLGYEHEKGGAQARRMFQLQDEIFEDLCESLKTDKNRRKSKKR